MSVVATSSQIRRTIREQQEIHGEDLFQVLTAEESDLLAVIRSGAAEFQHIVEESLLPEKRVRELLDDLVERGLVQERRKGGKTDGARAPSSNSTSRRNKISAQNKILPTSHRGNPVTPGRAASEWGAAARFLLKK